VTPDFFKADFLTCCKNSGTVGRPTIPNLLAFQIQISRFPDFFPSYSSAMDADSQARGGRGRRSGGVPNYRNEIIIEVVEQYLPQGLETWRTVALAYQRESMETVLHRGEDLWDNWNRKLCNRMQKPTGKPTVNTDRIFRFIAIERRIQDKAAAANLGAESAEFAHSRADGESAFSDVALFCPHPQSLPAFVGRRVGVSGVDSPGAFVVPGVGAASSAVSSLASRGGTTRKTNMPKPPRRSSTSLSGNISSGGVQSSVAEYEARRGRWDYPLCLPLERVKFCRT